MCSSERKSEHGGEKYPDRWGEKYPERWMRICGNCKKKLLLLITLDNLTYGILCGLNDTVGYEIYLKKEIPKNCLHKNEMGEQ